MGAQSLRCVSRRLSSRCCHISSVREVQGSSLRFSKSRLKMTPTGRRMFEVAKQFFKSEDGAALIEYGMLVMLIASVVHHRAEDNRKQSLNGFNSANTLLP